MLVKHLDKYLYSPLTQIKKAMFYLHGDMDICLIVDSRRILKAVLTKSDIRQAILDGVDPNWPISKILNQNFISAPENSSEEHLRKLSLQKSRFNSGFILKIPILGSNGEIRGLYINKERKYQTPRTIFVTGGAGYLGSVLNAILLNRGYKVITIDTLDFGRSPVKAFLKNTNFKIIKGNVSNINDLIKGVRYADAVIHLAGIVGDPASALNPLDTLEINHFSTKSIIDISKYCQVSKFIFASSCSVYGASNSILEERSKVKPISLYARSKLYTERDLLKASDKYFKPTILRFGTLYGVSPRMRFDLVVNGMVAQAYFRKNIQVFGGSQWRPFIHVQDAAEACIRALEGPFTNTEAGIYNAGADSENYQIGTIAMMIKKLLPNTTIHTNKDTKDLRNYKVSFKKIAKGLHFRNKYILRRGLKEIMTALETGKFKDYKNRKYSNYLTVKNKKINQFIPI